MAWGQLGAVRSIRRRGPRPLCQSAHHGKTGSAHSLCLVAQAHTGGGVGVCLHIGRLDPTLSKCVLTLDVCPPLRQQALCLRYVSMYFLKSLICFLEACYSRMQGNVGVSVLIYSSYLW